MATEVNTSPTDIRDPPKRGTEKIRAKTDMNHNSLLSREPGRIQDEIAISEMGLVDELEEYYDYDVTVEIRYLISARHAGGIIGKGGSYINKIRDETDCEFHVHQAVPNSPLRTGSARGRVRDVVRALLLMADKITELQRASRRISRSDFVFQYGDYNITLLLEHKNCGVIIGKCGARISCNRQRSGAHIKISTHVLESSSEKTIDIQGRREAVENALETLIVQIANDPKPNVTSKKYLDQSIKPHNKSYETKFENFGKTNRYPNARHQGYFPYFPAPNHDHHIQHNQRNTNQSHRNQHQQQPQQLSGPMNNLYGYWGPYPAYSQQNFSNPNPNHWNNSLHQYNNANRRHY